jgi:hypothetical protein
MERQIDGETDRDIHIDIYANMLRIFCGLPCIP